MTTESGFGAGGFGLAPFGDGDYAFGIVDAVAWRENVIRVEFNGKVFFNGLIDAYDAGDARKFTTAPVLTSVGMDGEVARPVSVVRSTLVVDDPDVNPADEGRFLDLVVDRPFTPYPALYTLTLANIFSEDKTEEIASESVQVLAVFAELSKPMLDEPSPSRDLANPQTLSMLQASFPRSGSLLATYSADDTGDYAFDQGNESLKKRLYRRAFTRKGAFAHLPANYGVGLQDYVKMLGTAAVQSRIATDAEAQFSEEPEVAKCRVLFVPVTGKPGGWIMRIYVKTRAGAGIRFDFNVG